MAHGNCESMRAFTKGRCAFDSDEEYRAALRGEFDDVREDFSTAKAPNETKADPPANPQATARSRSEASYEDREWPDVSLCEVAAPTWGAGFGGWGGWGW